MGVKQVTISELRRRLTNDLTSILSTGEAQSVTELILEHLGYSRSEILENPFIHIDNKIHAEIRKIVDELHKNRPIQYILGSSEFYGLKLEVSEQVLIPRQETEELVDLIIKEQSHKAPLILDIGTGSGCIAIALAKFYPGSCVHALDSEAGAIRLASQNAVQNQVDIDFHNRSLFDFTWPSEHANIDLLVSNPPYVTPGEKNKMLPNVLEHEPSTALFVPADNPLLFYREIMRLASESLAPEGIIWLEINEAFGPETASLYLDGGFAKAEVIGDIHGRDRFLKVMK